MVAVNCKEDTLKPWKILHRTSHCTDARNSDLLKNVVC